MGVAGRPREEMGRVHDRSHLARGEPGPSDNLAILAAIALAEPGDVIVAAGDGFTGTAIVGDNMAAMARNRKVAAIVADGLVRDSAGVVGVGLPMFARGITPNSCVRSGPGRIGL